MRRNADQWWAWHDADSSRWSESVEEAEARAASWVAGDSDDGPEISEKETEMNEYRVSDGTESEIFEAASADEALDMMFSPGYDWGETPEDLSEEDCQTSDARYTVWLRKDGIETVVLTGPLSDVR